jgi:hypothetical protein
LPTITIGNNTGDDITGTEDTQIYEGDPTVNQDGNDLDMGKFSGGVHRHGLIRFTGISSIPAGATITNATMYLWLNAASATANQTFTLRRSLRNWVEGQATWNVYSTGNSWTTAGGLDTTNDRSSASSGTSAAIGSTTGLYYAFCADDATFIANIQGFLDGDFTNNGWHIERTDAANDATFRVFTRSEGTDGQRPYLEVTYTEAAAGGSYVPGLPQRNRRHSGRYL